MQVRDLTFFDCQRVSSIVKNRRISELVAKNTIISSEFSRTSWHVNSCINIKQYKWFEMLIIIISRYILRSPTKRLERSHRFPKLSMKIKSSKIQKFINSNAFISNRTTNSRLGALVLRNFLRIYENLKNFQGFS